MTTELWLWLVSVPMLAVVIAQNMAMSERLKQMEARLEWISGPDPLW